MLIPVVADVCNCFRRRCFCNKSSYHLKPELQSILHLITMQTDYNPHQIPSGFLISLSFVVDLLQMVIASFLQVSLMEYKLWKTVIFKANIDI